MQNKIVFMLLAACMVSGGCKMAKRNFQVKENTINITSPNIYIYKTRGDYNILIPVDLSADKTIIVSYPDKKDVFTNGKLATPTILYDGFLLDNRGISPNVAFIKLSYQQYADLKATPSRDSLYNLIVDNDPLTVLYDCGPKSDYQDPIEELNHLIKSGNFTKFKKLK